MKKEDEEIETRACVTKRGIEATVIRVRSHSAFSVETSWQPSMPVEIEKMREIAQDPDDDRAAK